MKTEPASDRVIRALFLARGFDGVRVDEIARQAQVSKPTIYSHFDGKAV
jgi:TetR/AcrR family transcriptional repressor of mexJK operon